VATLIDHLESRLGRIQSGWNTDPSGAEIPFQVVEMRGGGQLEGSTSYSTLGVSSHALLTPGTPEPTHMECVMTTHSAHAPARIPQSVVLLGKELLDSHTAIRRGEVFPLPGPIAEGSKLTHLYAALPGYFDPDFDTVVIEDGTEVVIAWMVPIADSEAKFVHDKGWDKFEENLVKMDPDLLDLFREPLSLA
jgi:hypothetical protein